MTPSEIPSETPAEPPSDSFDLTTRILHRDGLIIVLDKPAGIACHRGPSGALALEDGFGALTFGINHTPHLAHRLDADTSGCLVLGRHPKALRKLGRLFSEGRVAKTYVAVVAGEIDAGEGDCGVIDRPLIKRSDRNGWRMEVAKPGAKDSQPSRTRWRVLARRGGRTWLALTPETGRTHQLRVHLASIGHPILGDPKYGGGLARGQAEVPRLQLHAWRIALPLAASRPPVAIEAPWPPDLLGLPASAQATTLAGEQD